MPRPTKNQIKEREALAAQGLKRCTACYEALPHAHFRFSKDGWDKRAARCRECLKEKDSEWGEKRDPEAKRSAARKWYQANYKPIQGPKAPIQGPKVDTRGPMRKAIEDRNYEELFVQLKNRVSEINSCWVWDGRLRRGYGVVQYTKKASPETKNVQLQAHRLMYEAYHRTKITPGSVIHHTCANCACIHPNHLQMIDPQSNNAEMLERRYYQKRISELECALSELDPRHELLFT
jgi:hypothetical protein